MLSRKLVVYSIMVGRIDAGYRKRGRQEQQLMNI